MYLYWVTKAVLLPNEHMCLGNSASNTNFLSYTKQWTSSSHLHPCCNTVFSFIPSPTACPASSPVLLVSLGFSPSFIVHACVGTCVPQCTHVGQRANIGNQFSFHCMDGSWRMNPGAQTWQQCLYWLNHLPWPTSASLIHVCFYPFYSHFL